MASNFDLASTALKHLRWSEHFQFTLNALPDGLENPPLHRREVLLGVYHNQGGEPDRILVTSTSLLWKLGEDWIHIRLPKVVELQTPSEHDKLSGHVDLALVMADGQVHPLHMVGKFYEFWSYIARAVAEARFARHSLTIRWPNLEGRKRFLEGAVYLGHNPAELAAQWIDERLATEHPSRPATGNKVSPPVHGWS